MRVSNTFPHLLQVYFGLKLRGTRAGALRSSADRFLVPFFRPAPVRGPPIPQSRGRLECVYNKNFHYFFEKRYFLKKQKQQFIFICLGISVAISQFFCQYVLKRADKYWRKIYNKHPIKRLHVPIVKRMPVD